jgi:uncharacterized protein (TIGR03067 family)
MKYIFIFVSLFIALESGAQDFQLVGKWKSTQKGVTTYLTFGEDSTFKLQHEKDSIGGKSFTFGEGEATSAFKVDTNYKPKHIDMLVIQTSSGAVIYKMEGIFEMFAPGKIRLRMAMGGAERPKSFLPRGNEETLIFFKQ